MTEEEKALLEPLNHWMVRIEVFAPQFDQKNRLGVRLPLTAATQLRNLSEATAACELVIQTFAGRFDASKESLQVIAGHLRLIHQRLDDVILPAAIAD